MLGLISVFSLISQDIQFHTAIDQCKAGTPFGFINAGFTNQELLVFESLCVKDAEYSRFGKLMGLKEELSAFLKSLGNTDACQVEHASTLVHSLTQTVLTELQAETAWVVMRVSTPHDAFITPRWHIDGYYYKPSEGIIFPKFAMTLKGPHTLFYSADQSEQKMVIDNLDKREYVAKSLKTEKIISPLQGQGAFFVVGNALSAAVHSEPDITSDRIFLAIVAGTEQQIQELKKRFKR